MLINLSIDSCLFYNVVCAPGKTKLNHPFMNPHLLNEFYFPTMMISTNNWNKLYINSPKPAPTWRHHNYKTWFHPTFDFHIFCFHQLDSNLLLISTLLLSHVSIPHINIFTHENIKPHEFICQQNFKMLFTNCKFITATR